MQQQARQKYLDNFSEAQDDWCQQSGLIRAVGMRLYYSSIFEPDRGGIGNAYSIIEKMKSKYAKNPRIYYEQVLGLASTGIPMKQFGISFNDMLNMDLPTFEQLIERVEKIREQKSKSLQTIADDLDES